MNVLPHMHIPEIQGGLDTKQLKFYLLMTSSENHFRTIWFKAKQISLSLLAATLPLSLVFSYSLPQRPHILAILLLKIMHCLKLGCGHVLVVCTFFSEESEHQ